MFTRCPSCRAAFSISDQQLEIAAGMVRCGMCEHVFDARLYLFQQHSADQTNDQKVDDGEDINLQSNQEVDVTLEQEKSPAIDLEFLDKQLHGSESVDQILEQDNGAERANDTNQVTTTYDAEPKEDIQEPIVPKVIADQVSNLENEASIVQPKQVLGTAFIIILIGLLCLQLISVAKISWVPEKIRDQACRWIICVENVPRAVYKIEVLNRSIYTHPNEDNALMVTVTIINRAEFAQPYPIIQLRFLNVTGDVIAARQFGANHYLHSRWQPDKLMEANAPLSIQLEVEDVGEEVVSYDFDFL